MKPGVIYEFAQGDLLENRNTYFYTAYQGVEFLTAWRAQRAEVITAGAVADSSEKLSSSAPIERFLNELHDRLSNDGREIEALRTLGRIVQRFEVTKRLHGEYNANWRPVDPNDYQGTARYIRFAEVLELAYAGSLKLPFLNALLKCMDTLTARAARLDSFEKKRVQRLAVLERTHVETLMRKVGAPTV